MSHDLDSRFEIAGGTVTGRSHVLSERCNQDAYTWLVRGGSLVAVVCDGCGSGAHSEVGAQLGARLVVESLSRRLGEGASLDGPDLWAACQHDVLGVLRGVAVAMGGRLAETVAEYFLFTVVGVALSGERGCVFAAGDGVIAVDGDLARLGPFPGNEPPYLGYGLLDRPVGLSVVRSFAAAEVRSVLVGTDGAADLDDLAARPLPGGGGEVGSLRQFWEEDRHFQNRDSIRRRLSLVNREVARPVWAERRMAREPGPLGDDATVVVVRRRRSG
jgi:Protein phosphatase 2C